MHVDVRSTKTKQSKEDEKKKKTKKKSKQKKPQLLDTGKPVSRDDHVQRASRLEGVFKRLRTQLEQNIMRVLDIFRKMDADHNGVLTPKE